MRALEYSYLEQVTTATKSKTNKSFLSTGLSH